MLLFFERRSSQHGIKQGLQLLLQKQLGIKTVSLGLEDATRADWSFLKKMAGEAINTGVDRLRLADTVGVARDLDLLVFQLLGRQ